MSNIYIQEPPTNGKVLLKTTVGDIDIELWSKETPLTCRNFIQLCMEGYYNNCIFHRLIKNFIVQTGDPTGTGFGGESIYGKPFKDEFHSRLRFVRRGLVAMANNCDGNNGNTSQFFFTLESTPELQNKHTIFGKVTGNTLYNMLRLNDNDDVDNNDRPKNPHRIRSIEILNNPFDDIVPRNNNKQSKKNQDEDKNKNSIKSKKGQKKFTLLSFGDEAEMDELKNIELTKTINKKIASKSSHDLLKNDEQLSSIPVIDVNELTNDNNNDNQQQNEENLVKIKKKFKNLKNKKFINDDEEKNNDNDNEDNDEEQNSFFIETIMKEKSKCIEMAKNEFVQLKKQLLKQMKNENNDKKSTDKSLNNKTDTIIEYENEQKLFKEKLLNQKKKGEQREKQCLSLLNNFQKRLQQQSSDNCEQKKNWLKHQMKCLDEMKDEIVLARDANMRNEEEWYNIYDPKNPINKRRRNE